MVILHGFNLNGSEFPDSDDKQGDGSGFDMPALDARLRQAASDRKVSDLVQFAAREPLNPFREEMPL